MDNRQIMVGFPVKVRDLSPLIASIMVPGPIQPHAPVGFGVYFPCGPIPVTARTNARVYSLSGTVGSNPARGHVYIYCEYCGLSNRGLCVVPINHTEEFYRMRCVWVWFWSLDNEETFARWRPLRLKIKFLGGNWKEREDDHSTLPSAETKNAWN